MTNYKLESKILAIEKRFKEICELTADLSQYPLVKQPNLQVKTNKDKSKQFGEVFTPLWLVDHMIDKVDIGKFKTVTRTLDLCSGYGQFSVRLIRKYYSVQGENFDLNLFFKKHWFNDIQESSCEKVIYIFGKDVNIAIGDSRNLKLLPEDARGIYYFNDSSNIWEHKDKRNELLFEEV